MQSKIHKIILFVMERASHSGAVEAEDGNLIMDVVKRESLFIPYLYIKIH